MVVNNANTISATVSPLKYNSPLLIDTNAMEASHVTAALTTSSLFTAASDIDGNPSRLSGVSAMVQIFSSAIAK